MNFSTVKATIGKDHYATRIITGSNHLVLTDEPKERGGDNNGPNPDELLAAALGACTCITLRMYADRKEWPVEKIITNVDILHDEITRLPHITLTVTLEGDLDAAQRARLTDIAGKCPMHKALTQPLTIDTIMQ